MRAGGPRILFLDLETTPQLAWHWQTYDSTAIDIHQHSYILSYSAKWKGGKHITRGLDDGVRLTKGPKQDDFHLVLELWQLLDAADIVVAHNGIDFDIRKINARFLVYSMGPPSPYTVIDTKRQLKRVALLSSNKLDWSSDELNIGRKQTHEGFAMWKACMAGDRKAFAKMKRYNRHDVVLLEKLFDRLGPWIKYPTAAFYPGIACSNVACDSRQFQARGTSRTRTKIYQRFQCNKCGAWPRALRALPQRPALVSL